MILELNSLKEKLEKISQKEYSILGIDWGEVRIGVAKSDVLRMMANPYGVVDGRNPKKALSEIFQIINDWDIKAIVIGLPKQMDNSEGSSAQKVREFTKNLDEYLIKNSKDILISFYDERLSSSAVEKMLINEFDTSRSKRKQIIDKLSASYMLSSALDFLNK